MNDLKSDLKAIYKSALKAADPYSSVLAKVRLKNNHLEIGERSYSLEKYKTVHVVGAGKASAEMGRAIVRILGGRLQKGLIVVRDLPRRDVPLMKILQAGHPEPDNRGLIASQSLIHYLQSKVSKHDLLLVLLSGGASALLPSPVEKISLDDKKATTKILLSCGATIYEINTIRKHLSRLKGGRFLNYVGGATVITLIISDVVGNDLSTIASGPTSHDPSTFSDCLEVLDRYQIRDQIPKSVLSFLRDSARGKIDVDTLKVGSPALEKTFNYLVSTNQASLQAAAKKAGSLGYKPMIISSSIQGNTSDLASFYVSIAREILATGHPLPAPCCLLSGGETTVKVVGDGRGGRNQEFALSCFHQTQNWKNQSVVFAAIGSDGSDGPTDAAGAIVSNDSRPRAKKLGLDSSDYLRRNDSYTFFQKLDDLIRTGPTGTNVMDFHFALIGTD